MCISNQALHVGKKEDVEKRKMTKSFCVYVHAGFLSKHIPFVMKFLFSKWLLIILPSIYTSHLANVAYKKENNGR